MSIAIEQPRKATKPVPAKPTIEQQIRQTLESNVELANETAKLARLRQEQSDTLSEFNGLRQVASTESSLASALLSGSGLSEAEAVEVKLSVLTKRLQAYEQAINSQKSIVEQCHAVACEDVVQALTADYSERRDRVCKAIEELENSNKAFAELQAVLSRMRIRNSFGFYGLQQISQMVLMLKTSVVEKLR